MDEFALLCEHGLYYDALKWVEENHSFDTPDYYFCRAYAGAYLYWYQEVELPDDFVWVEEALNSLYEFIHIVQDDLLNAIGLAFKADIEFNNADYTAALKSMSFALGYAPNDPDIREKAEQIMWDMASLLSARNDYEEYEFDRNWELDDDPFLNYDYWNDKDWDFINSGWMPWWLSQESAVAALILVARDPIHEN